MFTPKGTPSQQKSNSAFATPVYQVNSDSESSSSKGSVKDIKQKKVQSPPEVVKNYLDENSNNSALQSVMTVMTKELAKLKKKIAVLKAEKNHLGETVKNLEVANWKFQANLPALNSKLDDKEKVIGVLQNTITDLRRTLVYQQTGEVHESLNSPDVTSNHNEPAAYQIPADSTVDATEGPRHSGDTSDEEGANSPRLSPLPSVKMQSPELGTQTGISEKIDAFKRKMGP